MLPSAAQAPVQAVRPNPVSGVVVRVTTVPCSKAAMQAAGQVPLCAPPL